MDCSMDYLSDPARASLIQQIRDTNSLSEVRSAQSALRQWRQQHPQDLSIWDAGEELSLLEDALMEDDSPPGKPLSWTEWQWLEYRVIGARTLPDIAAARYALRQWVEDHPEQVKAEWIETLFLLLDVVEDGQTSESHLQARTERELAGPVA